ncbi:unnamed protein product [Calypogeia fissa]
MNGSLLQILCSLPLQVVPKESLLFHARLFLGGTSSLSVMESLQHSPKDGDRSNIVILQYFCLNLDG